MRRLSYSHDIEEDERVNKNVRLPSKLFNKNLDNERDREFNDAIKRLDFERYFAENKKTIAHVLDYIRQNPMEHKLLLMPHNAKMAERIARWIYENCESKNQE